MLFFGVVSAETEKGVEFFFDRDAAEVMIDEVREDERALAEEPRIEAIELGSGLREPKPGFRAISCFRSEHEVSPMLLALRGEELGFSPPRGRRLLLSPGAPAPAPTLTDL